MDVNDNGASKGALLRKTADEFDKLMAQFDGTKQRLVTALQNARLREDAIEDYVKTFDEGKKIIEELLPIRDNVAEIKRAIVEPVAHVIADSSDTNKRFGWTGIVVGTLGIIISIAIPLWPSSNARSDPLTASPSHKDLEGKLDALVLRLSSQPQNSGSKQITVSIYDRFDSSTSDIYETPSLPNAGDLSVRHGLDSIGFQPATSLIYKPIDVNCASGCYISFEAMVRLTESISIDPKGYGSKGLTITPPIDLLYQSANETTWKSLGPLLEKISIPWVGMKGRWQSVKTPYVSLDASLGVARIRLVLQNYAWTTTEANPKRVQSQTDFDEIKVLVAMGPG